MTFPVVESVTETSFASNTTSHACNLPATVDAGDLLLLIFANDGNTAQTTPSGWTALDQQTTGNQIYGGVYALDADGTEDGGTADVVTAIAEAGSGHVYRISGWGGDIATDIFISSVVAASTNSPSPGSVSTGGGPDDNLFIAITCFGDDDETASSAPTNYGNLVSVACGAGSNASGVSASARRELAAASDDPGSFSITGTDNTVSWTVGIAPATTSANPMMMRMIQEGHMNG